MDDYDAIIQNQLEEGIVEKAEMAATGMELYIPHKAVVRENAESTKLRIVYDASARGNDSAPSLNDCLEVGPPLQNQLWKVLVQGRFHAVALAGDIKKVILFRCEFGKKTATPYDSIGWRKRTSKCGPYALRGCCLAWGHLHSCWGE